MLTSYEEHTCIGVFLVAGPLREEEFNLRVGQGGCFEGRYGGLLAPQPEHHPHTRLDHFAPVGELARAAHHQLSQKGPKNPSPLTLHSDILKLPIMHPITRLPVSPL